MTAHPGLTAMFKTTGVYHLLSSLPLVVVAAVSILCFPLETCMHEKYVRVAEISFNREGENTEQPSFLLQLSSSLHQLNMAAADYGGGGGGRGQERKKKNHRK